MRLRLALIILLLVILPTALLCLLATRALHSSELLLRNELEQAATSQIRQAAAAVSSRALRELQRVKASLSGFTITSGAHEISARAGYIERESDLVARVLVFANPWGFAHPPGVGDELTAVMRRRVSSPPGPGGKYIFSTGDEAYCFDVSPGPPPMHVGYEIDSDTAAFLLVESLEAEGDSRLVMQATRPDGVSFRAEREGNGVVIVDDLLGNPALARAVASGNLLEDEEPLVNMRLSPPLDTFRVAAFLRDAEGIRRSQRLRSQFVAWGILVLAAGVCAGVWILVRDTALEVRRARSRSEVVAGISHDLRTPLSSMKMLAETLYMGRVTDAGRQREFLGTMIRECERLGHLVERVLFFVRFGQRALQYAVQETDPGSLVKAAVHVFGARFEGVTGPSVPEITVDVAERMPPVHVDESAMTQVLLNLLDNAEKYSGTQDAGEREERAPRIEVSVDAIRRGWPAREWVRVAVRDHGMGMDRRELRRVFKGFYRAPAALDKNLSGIGLGLALCRHVVRAHGGRMTVESTPGEGSVFAVLLPVRATRG